jgi:hypothetical protein
MPARDREGIGQGSIRTGGEIRGKQDCSSEQSAYPLLLYAHKAPPEDQFWRRRPHRIGCHLPGDGQDHGASFVQTPLPSRVPQLHPKYSLPETGKELADSPVRFTQLHARFKSLRHRTERETPCTTLRPCCSSARARACSCSRSRFCSCLCGMISLGRMRHFAKTIARVRLSRWRLPLPPAGRCIQTSTPRRPPGTWSYSNWRPSTAASPPASTCRLRRQIRAGK